MNTFLEQQLNENAVCVHDLPDNVQRLLDNVSRSYDRFEADMVQTEHRSDHCVKELAKAKRAMKLEAKQNRVVLDNLKAAILRLPDHEDIFTQSHRIENEDLITISDFLASQMQKRKEAENRLKLYERAIQSSSEGILITDPTLPDNPLVLCNPAFLATTGYTEDEVLGRNCRFLQSGESDQKELATIRKALAEHTPCTVILKNLKKNGTVFWNELTISPMFNKAGKLTNFIGIQSDITDQIAQKKALQNVAQQRIELMRAAEDLISARTESSVIAIVAQCLEKVLLYDTVAIYVVDEKEHCLRPIALQGPKWTVPNLDEWKIPIGQGIIGTVFATKDGELVNNSHLDSRSVYPKGAAIAQEHLIVQPLRSAETGWGVLAINRMSDSPFTIQEYEIAQFLTSYASLAFDNILLLNKFRESERSQRTILETIPDGVVSVNDAGTIVYSNEIARNIFGYGQQEMTGLSFDELVPGYFRQLHAHALQRDAGVSAPDSKTWQSYAVPGFTKNGTELPLDISFGETMVEGGKIFTGIIRDVTDLKHALWEMMNSKRIAEESLIAKELFFARMSHEIRTPMNGIIGLTNILLDTPLSGGQSELLKNLKLSGDNLLVIINDILDLAKIESGTMKFDMRDFYIDDVIANILANMSPLAGQKNIRIMHHIDRDVPPIVSGDPVRLNQILLNLVNNAVKFTNAGSVSVFVSIAKDDTENPEIEFRVKDTGIGIPADAIERLFTMFSQVEDLSRENNLGTGLGLAIVKQLAELLGGSVYVESELGAGSTFIVTLPLRRSAKPLLVPASTVAVKHKQTLMGRRVLVAEDFPINQQVVRMTLERWGAEVVISENGEKALAALTASHFDIVLMDVQMPVMDGFETTRRIRALADSSKNSVPVIAMTASVLNDAEERALSAGMDDYIAKPFEPVVLYNKIMKALKIEHQADEPLQKKVKAPPRITSLEYFTSISNGDTAFVQNMVDIYIRQSAAILAELQQCAAAAQWKETELAAHKLKPVFKMVGMDAAAQILATIEESAHDLTHIEKIVPLLKEVDSFCQKSYIELAPHHTSAPKR